MLPVTNHRRIHIPHSLATVAAIVALATALFAAPASDAPGQSRADMAAAAGNTEQIASVDQPDDDSQNGPSRAAHTNGGNSDTSVLSGLLPLVLPGIPEI